METGWGLGLGQGVRFGVGFPGEERRLRVLIDGVLEAWGFGVWTLGGFWGWGLGLGLGLGPGEGGSGLVSRRGTETEGFGGTLSACADHLHKGPTLCIATQLPHNFCISAWPMQKYFCKLDVNFCIYAEVGFYAEALCRSYAEVAWLRTKSSIVEMSETPSNRF